MFTENQKNSFTFQVSYKQQDIFYSKQYIKLEKQIKGFFNLMKAIFFTLENLFISFYVFVSNKRSISGMSFVLVNF